MDNLDDRSLQEAARWQARLQAMDCTDRERAAFERWRAAAPENSIACERAVQVQQSLDLLLSDARLQALAERALTAPQPAHKVAPRWMVPVSLAAGLTLAILGVHFSVQLMAPPAVTANFDTAPGQRRTLKLEDGSVVQMDVATRLAVRMSAARREVALLDGRALFEVAHDKTRPFTVSAGDSRTTALGTRFQVERTDERVLVTLTQGSVAIDAQRAGWREILIPGEQLSLDTATTRFDKRTVDLQLATSWHRGRHIFRSTPLAEAVDEVNRYAATKVRLGDPTLAMLPVGGSYIAGDSRLIVDALAAVLPIRVVAGSGNEIILFRRYE